MREPRTCLMCEREFLPRDTRNVYCSASCNAKAKYQRDRVRLAALDNREYQYKPSHVQQKGRRAPSHVDCVSYSVCLSNAAARGMASVPCVGCSQYTQEKFDIATVERLSEFSDRLLGIDGCGEGCRRKGIR